MTRGKNKHIIIIIIIIKMTRGKNKHIIIIIIIIIRKNKKKRLSMAENWRRIETINKSTNQQSTNTPVKSKNKNKAHSFRSLMDCDMIYISYCIRIEETK